MTDGIPAGWYPDPIETTVQRYWDGEQWIGEPIPVGATPPATPPSPPPEPAAPPPVTVGTGTHAEPPPGQPGALELREEGAPQRGTASPDAAQPQGTPAPPIPGLQLGARTLVYGRPLAPVSSRFMARFVDILLVTALNVVVNGWFVYQWWQEVAPTYAETQRWLAGQADELPPPSDQASNLQWAILFIGLALWFAYEVPAMANNGQTFGKRLFDIKVIRYDGEVPGFGASIRRWGFLALPNLVMPCFVPLQVADWLWCTWDRPLQQCLHDKTTRTVVVQLTPQDKAGDTDRPASEHPARRSDPS